MTSLTPRGIGQSLLVLLLPVTFACQPEDDEATQIIAQSIERYGGDVFDNVHIRFDFRGAPFQVIRDDGRFRYQRAVTDSVGGIATEVMENEGTWAEVEGARVELSPEGVYSLETAVNSVVYFGFLPFRLDDSAAILANLGSAEVESEPYHKIEVTFEQEGGGLDWDTRFVFWIHQNEATLDYLAYRYTRDGGGARFRRAINRREVGGLLIQDYENYAGDPEPRDIAEFDRSLENGTVELLSTVELEAVQVDRPSG